MRYQKYFKTHKIKLFGFRLVVAFLLFFGANLFFISLVFASTTNGTIDSTNKYAWGENIGWLNFGCDGCNVSVTDSNLSGNVWSTQYGWINLNPSTSGIQNTSEGTLSGFAWSSNLGWINFSGVTINSSGEFLGYATIKSDSSQINFNCINANSCSSADFKVKTDWRPASARTLVIASGGGSGHPVLPPTTPPITSPIVPLEISPEIPSVSLPVVNPVTSIVKDILNFLKPKKKIIEPNIIAQVPKSAPVSFQTRWNLLPVKAIREFIFAPLPYEIRTLASKFPALDNTLKDVGVKRFTDIEKLTNVTLNIPNLAEELNRTIKNVGVKNLNDINNLNGVGLNVPGLSNINGKITNNLGIGKIALIKGLPIANFSLSAKNNLPSEFVFVRANGELVDLNVVLSIGDKGKVNQTISTLPGKMLKLVVKPISKARSVTGYFIFKSATPRITQNEISRSSLTASALFSAEDLVQKIPELVPVEKKLVLSTFEYTDSDNDGIYTADVITPSVPGEYEVVTIIDYIDPVLGIRRMSMITVIDPEGYIFEKNNGKETRIPSAIVSLYYLNTVTKKYELWKAKDYQQDNPQITDVRGTYSFLVPEGSYYFEVEAPGYYLYKGKVFVVAEGSGIHQNIELKSGLGWLYNFDWRTILLIVVFLLLVYNLYRNSLRDKLLNFSNKNNEK